MFINPDIVKAATFLVENDEPVSTVFFVKMPSWNAAYAVTTRHSIKGTQVSIRFNLKDGGTEDKATLRTEWITHDDTDVAVLPLIFPLHAFDIEFIRDTDLKSYMDHYKAGGTFPENAPWPFRYGAGDEVFSIGLFDRHSGVGSTRPVVRFGHVALVPGVGEKVLAEIFPEPHDLVAIDAFLVEISTWGGQSGSPVFLRPTASERRTKNRPRDEKNYLIGMIQGFYPGEQDVKINGMDATLSPLNMGIGIVIPAKDIMEVLMGKELKDKREQSDKERARGMRPSAASLNASKTEITKGEFEEALKKASQKVSEPEPQKQANRRR